MEFIVLLSLSFISWISGKLADAFHEHGLKSFFPGAGMLFSIIWWLIVWFLISQSSIIYISYVTIIFYWIYKVKFDYSDHAIALLIIIYFMIQYHWYFQLWDIAILFFVYVVIDYVKSLKISILIPLYKNKIQFLIIPIAYCIYANDIFWIVVLGNLIGSLSISYLLKRKN